MAVSRREFVGLATGGCVSGALLTQGGSIVLEQKRYKAIAFDAFTVFDPRPVFTLAETLFPGHGSELTSAWRTRQFEYQWLRALSGRYADFWHTTDEALVFAARSLRLELPTEKRGQLMDSYLGLKAWPDVRPSMMALQKAGIRLAILSNMTAKMLDANIQSAGLEGVFEQVLSTDRIRSYKPDPRAYAMAFDALKLRREDILFAPFAGWDAAGAKWIGYPTFWVNRLNAPGEELGVAADAAGHDLSSLVRFAGGQN